LTEGRSPHAKRCAIKGRRSPSAARAEIWRADRRKVELALTPHGRDVLATLAGMHRRELKRLGPILKRFFTEISG
jgi:hypothetical protein